FFFFFFLKKKKKKSYDYIVYLGEVVQRGYIMDDDFQREVKEIFTQINCPVMAGPVKKQDRSKTKAQLDYNQCHFPKSAQILDVVRCCAVFPSIAAMYDGLTFFKSKLKNKHQHKQFELEIMRCKNGFYWTGLEKDKNIKEKSNRLQLPIPNSYRDVKFNLIFTDLKKKISIVGELQFLLRPIVEFQHKYHHTYEVLRRKDFVYGSKDQLKTFDLDKRIEMTAFNEKLLGPLLVQFPRHFLESNLIQFAKEKRTGKNIASQMAYNPFLSYGLIRELFHSNGRYMNRDVIQRQLKEKDARQAVALMNALSFQRNIRNVVFFIPNETDDEFWQSKDI
ncbi:hypothetical protein RFI_18126, partial [Reticulomyxa filosa]